MTEKYKLQQEDINSMDLNGETLAKLKQILPEVFSEGADGKPSIDIERLKIALGGAVDVESDNKSRFSFNWSGKKQAQALANQPSTATLRPSVEESKNWDDTQNVYIEGDNLEVLKLLQKSYYNSIKMIYIDPPYNTGKDFVYKDNFHDNVKNYLQLTGQVDDEGNKISTNTDKSGRYHTDWLNMMYPRLKLARNLLKDDGVIFISIDDNEVHNLRKICDEIFGEDNFIASFIWEKRTNRENRKMVSQRHDYILCYAKNLVSELVILKQLPMNEKALANYSNPDNDHRGLWKSDPATAQAGHGTKSQFYTLVAPNGKQHHLPSGRCWLYTEDVFKQEIADGKIWFGKNGNGVPRIKTYLESKERGLTIESMWFAHDASTNEIAKNNLKTLFNDKAVFETPKPIELVKIGLQICTSKNDIILDFFSGAATTAHAVIQQNAEDGGVRKYICVQLPELTYNIDENGNEVPKENNEEAYKAGYKNICEIGKERIRRAGEKVLAEWTEKQQKSAQATANAGLFADDAENSTAPTSLDIGFKVFKLDTSNIKPFDSNDMFANDLLVDGRSALDLFYELVLKQGYSLDNRQCVLDIGGTRCYALVHEDDTPFVLAVLDDTVKPNFALELLKYALTLVIVKDECFGTDEVKLNLLATLEQLQTKDNPLQIRII